MDKSPPNRTVTKVRDEENLLGHERRSG